MNPELVALAKRLRRRNPETGEGKSLRAIAAELARLGPTLSRNPLRTRNADKDLGAPNCRIFKSLSQAGRVDW